MCKTLTLVHSCIGNKWRDFFPFCYCCTVEPKFEIQRYSGPLTRKFKTNETEIFFSLLHVLFFVIRFGNTVHHIRGAAAFLIKTDTLTSHRSSSLGGERGGEEHFLISVALTLITRSHPWVLPVCPVQTQA